MTNDAAELNVNRAIHGSEPGAALLLSPASFDFLSLPHIGLGLGPEYITDTAECHRPKVSVLKRLRRMRLPFRPTNHWLV